MVYLWFVGLHGFLVVVFFIPIHTLSGLVFYAV